MATKKTSESIDDSAFQALEAALRIDFEEEDDTPVRSPAPAAAEAKVSDTPRQTKPAPRPSMPQADTSALEKTECVPLPRRKPQSPQTRLRYAHRSCAQIPCPCTCQ